MKLATAVQLLASLNSPPVSVRAAGDRGKGLFATSAVIKGDVIFQERPLVSLRPLLPGWPSRSTHPCKQ